MKKENIDSIAEKVVSRIERGELKMKPRIYFIAKIASIIGLLFLSFLLVLYFGSLIIFILRINDIFLFHGMGFQVIRSILLSFPWYLVLLIFVLIAFIGILGKGFRFVYRKPLIITLLSILILVVVSSFLIERSSLHYSFFRMAEEERLPLAGKMYRDFGNLDIEDAHFGMILEKENGLWEMELESGETVSLQITEKTRSRRIFSEIKEGSRVIVIGEMREGTIDVVGIKKIERRFRNQRPNER